MLHCTLLRVGLFHHFAAKILLAFLEVFVSSQLPKDSGSQLTSIKNTLHGIQFF